MQTGLAGQKVLMTVQKSTQSSLAATSGLYFWSFEALNLQCFEEMSQKLAKTAAKGRSFERQLPIRIVIANTGSISKLSVSNFGKPASEWPDMYGTKTFL